MTKHTPRPWRITKGSHKIIDDEGDCIFRVYGDPDEERIANARLITAAPEMKDALESIACMYIRPDTNHQELSALCMAIARTALEKAERGE